MMAHLLSSRHSFVGYRTCQLGKQNASVLTSRLCAAQQRNLDIKANAFKTGSAGSTAARQQQAAIIAIDPSVPSNAATTTQSQNGPLIPVIALAVGALGLVAMFVKKLRGGGSGDHTSRYSVNMHLANVMKDVNTVRIEDLSPDQIEAARARRSKERANHKLSLEEIDLPQNHPFATKQVLSKEEVEQSLQNLRLRSMRRRNYEAMQAGGDNARAGPGTFPRQR